jgi:hypothetical protein
MSIPKFYSAINYDFRPEQERSSGIVGVVRATPGDRCCAGVALLASGASLSINDPEKSPNGLNSLETVS